MDVKSKLSIMTFGSNLFSSFIGIYVLILIEEKFSSVLFNSLFGDLSRIILIIVALFIAPIIESLRKQKLILTTYLIMALLLLPVLYYINGNFSLVTLLLLDIFMAFFLDINNICRASYIKLFVDDERLQETLGSIGGYSTFGYLLGTISAAFLFGHINLEYVIIIGLFIYLLNLLLMLTMPKDAAEVFGEKGYLQQLKVGFTYIQHSKLLRLLVFIIIVFNACEAVVTSLIVFYWGSIDQGFSDTLLIILGIGVGVGLGLFWVNFKKNYKHPLSVLLLLSVLNGCSIVILGFAHNKLLFSIFVGLLYCTSEIISPIVGAMRVKATSIKYTTRVTSIIKLFSSLFSVLIILVFATLSDLLKVNYIPYLATGIVTILSIIYVTIKLRHTHNFSSLFNTKNLLNKEI